VTQFRVRRGHFSVCCGARVNQYRVWCGSVEGCDVAQLRMGCGSVRVQCGSVKGAAWLSRVRCGSVRVWHGPVQGAV
jgi:hypothetical protein